ncbi:agamous-like MADS-box protein AGL61 [Carex rostrata]
MKFHPVTFCPFDRCADQQRAWAAKEGWGCRLVFTDQLVCFSRHRSTLFSKAYKLYVLCRVHVKVAAFSHAGKLYSCAYPSNSNILNSMFTKDLLDQNVVSISNSQTDNLSQQVSELTTRLEAAKKKNEALEEIVKDQYIMSTDVSKMELAELEALKKRSEQALAS